jgi:hypothetical protein
LPTAVVHRDQTIAQALREAFKYPSFRLLMAGYFVCGFQVVFIGVHMPSYLKDKGLSPQVASYALALIGLFNVFGTYAAGVLGQRMAKRKILAFIYLARAVAITVFLLVPLTPVSVYMFRQRDGAAVAVHRATDQRHRGADFRRGAPVDAGRLRVLQPPDRQLHGRVAGRRAVRPHRQLRHRLVHRHCPGRVGGADQPAGQGNGHRAPYAGQPRCAPKRPEHGAPAQASGLRRSAGRAGWACSRCTRGRSS